MSETDFLIKQNGIKSNGHNGNGPKSPEKPAGLNLDSKTVKINWMAWHFRQIMETIGMDMNDDSLEGPPCVWLKCM